MLSVIIPVYQAEQVLNKCVDSVLSQSYSDLEVILVDDGSTDRSGSICDQYTQMDSRVKVIHQKNSGVSAARNRGLESANGEYIIFVDSDDYIDSEMYQSMMEVAVQYDCDVVMCDCVKEFEDRSEIYTHDIRPGYYNREQIEKEYFQHLLMMPNVEYPPTISNWVCLFKQGRKEEATKDKDVDALAYSKTCLRYEEGIRFSEDLLFGAELLYHAESFYYMKGRCFYHYCMNPQSATHTFAVDKWEDYIRLHNRIEDKFFNCKEYDFSHQIDLVLLFFVYNAVGDIVSNVQLGNHEKLQKCEEILQMDKVRQMFSRLDIWQLPISVKLKMLTFIYKYRIGIRALIKRKR